MKASEHPWKYGAVSGLMFGAAIFIILYFERPTRAIIPLGLLAAVAALVYAVLLAELHSKWLPRRRATRSNGRL